MKIFLFLILTLFLIAPAGASALGLVTAPITVENALRGEKIFQELNIVNTEDRDIVIELGASGQIADWALFYYPEDRENPIATTTLAARERINMFAVISVPADAPNGDYRGALSATQAAVEAEESEDSFVTLAQKIDRPVAITVSDEEEVSLAVSVIPRTYDLKIAEPLSTRIIYDNQGNVSLRPAIDFKIKLDDRSVYNAIYPYPESEPSVSSKEQREIPAIEILTANLVEGKYVAELIFTRGEETLAEKKFAFSIGAAEAANAEETGYKKSGFPLYLFAILLAAVIAWVVGKKYFSRKQK